MEESICEPEKGEILGESEDEDLKAETSRETKMSNENLNTTICVCLKVKQIKDNLLILS